MRWQTKARVQRFCAAVPFGDALYGVLQRKLGGLRGLRTETYVEPAQSIVRFAGPEMIERARTFEIGTGWSMSLPIALYLCGAPSCVTVDLNPYLDAAITERGVVPLADALEQAFADMPHVVETIRSRRTSIENRSLTEICRLGRIAYRAPADASHTYLDSESVDIVYSNVVMQHVPPESLGAIFEECRRILAPGGFAWHRIDFSDQFSHSDDGITSTNFLSFDERKWRRIAGNRYAYCNRLRFSQIVDLLERTGFAVEILDRTVDEKGLQFARSTNLPAEFASCSDEDLSVSLADIACVPKGR